MENESFYNEQVETEMLPNHNAISYEALEPKYLKSNLIVVAIFWIIALSAIIIVSLKVEFLEDYRLYFAAGITLLFIGISLLIYFGFTHKGYALRQKDISYKSGLIWRETTALPFNRVQHCEINEGPIDRLFGLSSIKIFTAGGSSSDLEIPGVSKSTAELIKSFVIKKTAVDEEE